MGSETGLPGFVSSLFVGDECIGQVRVQSQRRRRRLSPRQSQDELQQEEERRDVANDDDDVNEARAMFGRDIRVARLSPASDRCRPLLVLHTVSLDSCPWLKLDQPPPPSPTTATTTIDNNNNDVDNIDDTNTNIDIDNSSASLRLLHTSCLEESKTAVVPLADGVNECHLVAVRGTRPTFWAFRVRRDVYANCLQMLNLRCLAMVFDLDETLILANTMRSFEDRIEALRSRIHAEKIKMNKADGQRVSQMLGELERYQEDKLLLKQFADNNFVMDNGRVIPAQMEEVPATVEGAQPIWRPVIRIPERNLIFTRIVPNVRDTSILVRLRPSWEELRNYVIAKGRKRFEVFICTMSEKEYALEMWRLLDPDARLIDAKQLPDRLLCVRSGSKKSLTNLFQNVCCHPRLAMVIDDRPDVWEDGDRQNVHAVPAFAPYFAPHAEASFPLPIMCIARNIASTVRGSFFKDFDETLSHQFSQVDSDTDTSTFPSPPHVATYLSEMLLNDSPSLKNSPKDLPDGIAGPEVQTAVYTPQAAPPFGPPPGFAGYGQVNMDEPNLRPLETVPKPVAPAGGGWLDEDDTNLDSPTDSDVNSNNTREAGEIQEYMKPELVDNIDGAVRNLQEYGKKCNLTIEFKFLVNATIDLLFTSEIFIDGMIAGKGIGRTSREAKNRAAEHALKALEGPQPVQSRQMFKWNSGSPGFQGRMPLQEDIIPVASTSGKQNEDRRNSSFNATLALKTLCTSEGLKVNYLERPNSRGTYNCEVEVDGRVLGRGSSHDWETAKHQAAEQALREFNPGSNNNNENNHKRNSPRLHSSFPSKRAKVGDAPPWRPPSASYNGRGGRDRERRPWGRTHNSRR